MYWIVTDEAFTKVVTPSVVIPYPEKKKECKHVELLRINSKLG